MRLTFDAVRDFAKLHWGLTLTRNDPTSRGWWNGCWKTGFDLHGNFPGLGHSHRRFPTLKAAAKAMGMK